MKKGVLGNGVEELLSSQSYKMKRAMYETRFAVEGAAEMWREYTIRRLCRTVSDFQPGR